MIDKHENIFKLGYMNYEIPKSARTILAYLKKTSKNGEVKASFTTIERACKLSHATVYNGLALLRAFGLIQRVKLYNENGGYDTNIYRINEDAS